MLRQLIFVTLLAIGTSVFAQETRIPDGRLMTISAALQQFGIQQDAKSLEAALGNPMFQIRRLAAARLAEKNERNSLPRLFAALRVESQPDTKEGIALSIAQLGGAAGVTELRATCDAAAADAGLRLLAAGYLQDYLEDDHCRHVVEDLAVSAPESEDRVRALDLLTGSASTTSSDRRRTKGIVIRALADKDIVVRLVAADHLAHIGSKADAPVLERAIAAEQNPDVRDSMETDLNSLRER